MLKIFVLLSLSIALFADISVKGSTTLRPVIKDAAKVFSKTSGINISVKGSGSSHGIASLQNKECDIAMVSKELTSDEKKQLQVFPIAMDGLAMIVHKNNPIKNITTKEIIDIYGGEKKHWKNTKPISVVHKENGRGTQKVFTKYFKLDKSLEQSRIVGSNTEALLYISTDEEAIGYVSIGAAQEVIEKGLSIKILSLDGTDPSIVNIKNGTYPIKRTLYIAIRKNPTKDTHRFVDFLLSNDVKQFINKHNYIPLEKNLN